jgi:6-phosphofructokinase 2
MASGVLTLTLNPTVDKSTTIDKMVSEQKLRCAPPKYEPGGGGINVSRALKRLGTESIAIFPAGGRAGSLLQDLLKKENIQHEAIKTKGETRENFIVVESSSNQQFRFGMPGSDVFPDETDAVLSLIRKTAPAWLVVSGSLPPGVAPDFLATIASLSQEVGARLIVDTSGDALKQAVDQGVHLLKPNLGELSKLIGVESLEMDLVDEAAIELVSKGKSDIVVVSMGPKGAILVTKDVVEQVPAPAVKKLSTVGAGDSMVAGMVHALSQGKSMKEVVRMGVACGTAATMNPGTELFRKEDVDRLYQWLNRAK